MSKLAGEIAECARQLVLEPYLVQLNKFSLRPEFENLLQLFFGAYKSAAIVFRNTFDIIDICVLCVSRDSIKEIYNILTISYKNSIYLLQ